MKKMVLKPIAGAVSTALLQNAQHNSSRANLQPRKDDRSWDELKELSDSIAAMIEKFAIDTAVVVELVKENGCEHMSEFFTTVDCANRDLLKFTDDFVVIRDAHKDRSGGALNADEQSACFAIFEKYHQFSAFFTGAMGHTFTSFTEFALEAKEIAEAKKMQNLQITSESATIPLATPIIADPSFNSN